MKFLLDQALPRSTIGLLQALGMEAEQGLKGEDVARIIGQVVEATEPELIAARAKEDSRTRC